MQGGRKVVLVQQENRHGPAPMVLMIKECDEEFKKSVLTNLKHFYPDVADTPNLSFTMRAWYRMNTKLLWPS